MAECECRGKTCECGAGAHARAKLSPIERAAVEALGATDDPWKAGWLLSDGTLLNNDISEASGRKGAMGVDRHREFSIHHPERAVHEAICEYPAVKQAILEAEGFMPRSTSEADDAFSSLSWDYNSCVDLFLVNSPVTIRFRPDRQFHLGKRENTLYIEVPWKAPSIEQCGTVARVMEDISAVELAIDVWVRGDRWHERVGTASFDRPDWSRVHEEDYYFDPEAKRPWILGAKFDLGVDFRDRIRASNVKALVERARLEGGQSETGGSNPWK